MHTNKFYIAVLGLVVVLFSAPIMAEGEITLEDAVRIGLKNNFNIQIARNSAKIAETNKKYGIAGFLPTLNATGAYSLRRNDVTTNSPSSLGDTDNKNWEGRLNLNWIIFDGFNMFTSNSRFNEQAALGKFQSNFIIENNVVAISRAYFNLVQQEQLLDVARDVRVISKLRLEKEKVRREVGGASSTDYLNAQVAYNIDEASFINQELSVIIAQKELNLLLGREPIEPLTVKKTIEVPPLNFNYAELQSLAEENNNSLQVARQNKKISDKNVASARSTFLPKLSLTAGYAYTDGEIIPDEGSRITTQNRDKTIGLNLSFNIFNGGRDRIQWQAARLEANNKNLALRDEKNQLLGLIREKYDTYQSQLKLTSLQEQNVEAARQNLDLQQDKYNIGATTSIEFRDAQVNFSRAQNALINARYQARITLLEIQQLIGGLEIN